MRSLRLCYCSETTWVTFGDSQRIAVISSSSGFQMVGRLASDFASFNLIPRIEDEVEEERVIKQLVEKMGFDRSLAKICAGSNVGADLLRLKGENFEIGEGNPLLSIAFNILVGLLLMLAGICRLVWLQVVLMPLAGLLRLSPGFVTLVGVFWTYSMSRIWQHCLDFLK
ncbi:hypothetical protein R1sor_003243 [Riccia sorocarpa]|uniref:Uncharacterized protein n=1 Tax=Riccia sorocarpa TaxID=122646 RepID=A0ABD3H2P3_9MARC